MNGTKRLLKAAAAAGLCTAIAANTVMPAYAANAFAEKDENIYAALTQDGSVSGIYVVNEFSSETGGELSDYGDYSSVKNLTDQSELRVENGSITAEMSKGKFYYQGNLDSKELPWNISIQYFLDGANISANDLAGKSGALKIVLQTKRNPNCDETFFEHYLLQVTVVLNTENCTKIQAEGATAGNVGENRQLVYSILPGEEAEIEITAEVRDFEMEGISFQGVPMTLAISEDMLDELDLSDQTKELMDAVTQLDDGAGELKEGTEAAADGGKKLAEGISQLADGTGELDSGGSSLTQGTSALVDGTKNLKSGVTQYVKGVDSFAAGVAQYVAGVEMLAQGSKLLAPLENLSSVDDAVAQMYQAVVGGETQQGTPSLQAGAKGLAEGLHQILDQVKLLESATDLEKLQELQEALTQIQSMTAQLAGTLGEVGAAVGRSADMLDTIEASHQAVLDEVNDQIDKANSSISDTVANVNEEIDHVVSAVQAAAEAGTLDTETAEQTIERLKSKKLEQSSVSAVEMPKEDGTIQDTIAALKTVFGTLKDAAEQFEAESKQLESAAKGIQDAIPSVGDSSGIAQLSQALSTACEGADGLSTGIEAIGAALGQLKEGTSFFGEAGECVAALNAGFDALCEHNSLLISSGEALIGAEDVLLEGVSALTFGTEELNNGAGKLAEGISSLHQGTSLLEDNTGALTSGLEELDEGTGKLKEGTAEFREQTDGMDQKIREKLEELLDEMSGNDFEPVSFLSERNTRIGLVQFAISAEGIRIPDEAEEPEPEQEEGFLDRLLRLFR